LKRPARANIRARSVWKDRTLTLAAAPRKTRKPAEPKPPVVQAPGADAAVRIAEIVLMRLDEDKAEDVVAIDLQGKSPLADTIIVASGRSQRHVSALADRLLRALKEGGFGKAAIEGLPQADWVLIDVGDVIVHLFRPEVRAFYQIEKIWSVDSPHRTPAPSAY
jgi:ribosome-associated protein